ncbi:MAG: hypothetical protein HYU64_02730, partial [Armatimonadetes bacterium]|nr:hypothetical protein [Armatimonadota bacterium]
MIENRRLTKATDDLRRRLDSWRKTHRSPTPIPPKLWDRAVELAAEQGLCKTARALRLDYSALKKRAGARTTDPPASPVPRFVEWLTPLSGQIAECALEVESARGAR